LITVAVKWFLAASLSLYAHATPVRSTELESTIRQHLSIPPVALKVGDWVTYQMDGGEGRRAYWRLAIVGEEKDSTGRDAQWVEVEIGLHPELASPLAQMRILIADWEGTQASGVLRLIVAMGNDAPQEVSPVALQEPVARVLNPGNDHLEGAELKEVRVRTGRETRLMTYAGSVVATAVEVLYRDTVMKRLWMSRDVPVLHLAKLELPAIKHVMEVRAFGTGAVSRIQLPSQAASEIQPRHVREQVPNEGKTFDE
jgi:hypothetical protein